MCTFYHLLVPWHTGHYTNYLALHVNGVIFKNNIFVYQKQCFYSSLGKTHGKTINIFFYYQTALKVMICDDGGGLSWMFILSL